MKEVLITSSILILAVMVLRLVFRGKVSQKLIYGAWLLVALRLLVPVQFGSFDFSILNQTEPVTEVITEVSKNPVAGPSREEVYQQIAQDYIDRGEHIFIPEVEEKLETGEVPSYEEVFQNYPIQSIVIPEVNTQIQQEVEKSITAPTVGQIATAVWITGMVAMALWFGLVNLRFHRALAKTAKPMEVPDSPVPVMVDDTVASPCLFGFFRPKVYLTPVCTKDETHLRHVLTHELTHYAHKDHIWSLVRCVCLCVYWFNPLVWIAAGLAKRDCELACDEAVLKKLGDEERISYGKTLVDMVANSSSPAHYLETATAMHESKEQLAERIGRIICKPKFLIAAAVALVAVLVIIAGFVFAGPASHTDDPPAVTVPTAPPPTTTAPPETTVPPTTAPPETTVPPTTAPAVEAYCDLPQITVAETLTTLPNKPALADLVTTGYEGSAQWVDLSNNVETVTIQLPAITPFSADAIAINKEIRDTFSPILEDVKGYYDQQVSTFVYTVSYEAWLNGNILSILITRDTPFDFNHYHIFTLDITTGKALSQPELISRVLNVSYPEFLYHATYTAYDHFHERDSSHGPLTDAQNEFLTQLESSASYISLYQLYLGENDTPMLCSSRPGELYPSIELPYDAAAHGSDPEKAKNECHRWLFSMKPVTTYGTLFEENQNEAWARLLKKCFDCDGVKLLQYLSSEDTACIDRVTAHLIKGVPAEDHDTFAAQCQNLTQHSDPAVAQLAQTLLNALS